MAKDAEVKYPSKTMLVGESKHWNATRGEWWGHYWSQGYQDADHFTRYHHDGRANISFCDGHAKTGTEGQWNNGEWLRFPDARS